MARTRLKQVPAEQDRLVDGYGKGLIPDDRMRERMGALQSERGELTDLCAELEQTLASLELSQEQELAVVRFAERARSGLKNLGFDKRQELMQLLVENVTYQRDKAIIRTILPLDGPTQESSLCATNQGGRAGRRTLHFSRD